MKSVLERGGGFSGINRKVQLKPLKWDAPIFSSDELQSKLKLHVRSPPSSSSPSTPNSAASTPVMSSINAPLSSLTSSATLRRSATQEVLARFDVATPAVSAPSSPTRDPERVTHALLILKVLFSSFSPLLSSLLCLLFSSFFFLFAALSCFISLIVICSGVVSLHTLEDNKQQRWEAGCSLICTPRKIASCKCILPTGMILRYPFPLLLIPHIFLKPHYFLRLFYF